MSVRLLVRAMGVLILVVAGMTWSPVATLAATLHALFVIDTDDANIGRMVARDLDIMGDEVQRIAQATGLTLNDRVYRGRDFTTKNVMDAVRSIAPARDDVVLFYYSGHGFRTKNKNTRWPYLYFHNKPPNPVDFGWVVDEMARKGARLTLVLTDSCNNVVNVQIRETQKALPQGMSKAANGYRELFLNYRGLIAAASSIPGETSTATSSGSLFTLSFLKALRGEVVRPRPTWESLMQKGAGSRLRHQGSDGQVMSQMPFYSMQVKPIAATTTSRTPAPPPPTVQPPAPTVQPPTPTVQPPPPPVQQPPASSGGWQVIN
jgi:hypothetical protein